MPNSTRSFDLAVVGGGVIGLAVAWRAAQHGLEVAVLERGEAGAGTSRFAAGMLAPISEADASEVALLRLGLDSARLYPEFVADLRDSSTTDPGYLECGTLLVARDRDEAEALDRQLALRERLGLPVRRLLASDVRRREPALAPALRLGLEIPDDHAIDPRLLVRALVEALLAAGGEFLAGTPVAEVLCERDRVTGLRRVDGDVVSAPEVVIAAGVWSPELGGLPDDARVPVHPVKGQIMRLHDPAGPGLLHRILRFQGGYVVPRGDGRYVVGATMEERGLDTTVTAGGMREILRDATELLPGLDELVIDELSAGLRPATPDNAPILGPGALTGLHWATGHYRHGILLAPVTAQLVVDALVAGTPIPEPYGASRFAAVRA